MPEMDKYCEVINFNSTKMLLLLHGCRFVRKNLLSTDFSSFFAICIIFHEIQEMTEVVELDYNDLETTDLTEQIEKAFGLEVYHLFVMMLIIIYD